MPNKILSKKELKNLFRVRTTVKEAKQIKKRNLLLLEAVNKRKLYVSEIGCPHCKVKVVDSAYEDMTTDCEHCAWKPFASRTNLIPCFGATFGGVSLLSLQNNGLSFYHDEEAFEPQDLADSPMGKEVTLRRIVTFLKGHIEWADAILEKSKSKKSKKSKKKKASK